MIRHCRAQYSLVCLFAMVFIVLTPLAYAGDSDDGASTNDSLLGWSIYPGVGVRILDIHIKRKSDGYTGTMTNDGSFSEPMYASLNVETPTYLLTDSFGVSIRAFATKFSLKRQSVKSDTTSSGTDYADFGTRISGDYSYYMPTLFYRTVDKNGGDSRFGIGRGYWNAKFSGDIILARNGDANASLPKTEINESISGKTGWYLFWQTRWPKGLFEISISNASFASSNYDFDMQELNMMVGYAIHF